MIYIPRQNYTPDLDRIVLNFIVLINDWTKKKLLIWEPAYCCSEISFKARIGQGKDEKDIEIHLSYQEHSLFMGCWPKFEHFFLSVVHGVIEIFSMKSDEYSYEEVRMLFRNVYEQIKTENQERIPFSMKDFNWDAIK